MKICRDCQVEWDAGSDRRPAEAGSHPRIRPIVENSGSRCATHWREEKKRRKAAAHEKRVQKVYGLSEGQYWGLYEAQGGVCYICLRANGRTKKLAVDHDHVTGRVRGLLCSTDNRLIGHARDNPEFFDRAAEYLRNPPADRLGITAYHEESRDD